MDLHGLSELYHEQYQRDSVSADAMRAWEEIADALLVGLDVEPRSWVDVGCGGGGLLYALGERGIKAIGIEGSVFAMGHLPVEIWLHDLREPLPDGWREAMRADVVSCFDVGEHVGAAEQLVETLAALTERTLLFGAAPPDQDGLGHIDCRPPEEWRALVEARGLVFDSGLTETLRVLVRTQPHANFLWWVEKNLQAFRRAP